MGQLVSPISSNHERPSLHHQADGHHHIYSGRCERRAGVFFGIYMGNAGIEGATLTVGDTFSVTAKRPWDAHIRRSWARGYMATAAVLLAMLALAMALFQPILLGALRG